MKKSDGAQREPLSKERIFRTALDLIEQTAVEKLSMRKLAAVLGVDAMSIYYHIANKQALLLGVYQIVLDELELPAEPSFSWQDRLRELAIRFYHLARRYPNVMPHLINSPYGTHRTIEIFAFIMETVAQTGLDEEDQQRATAAIFTYAVGIANIAINGLGLRPLYKAGDPVDPVPDPSTFSTEEDVRFSVELVIAGIEKQVERKTRR